jgi:hypothetical protein
VPIGTIAEDGKAVLGHASDRCLAEGEEIILLAPREETLSYKVEKFCKTTPQPGRSRAKQPVTKLGMEPEVIIVYGWGALIGPFLVQLDIEICAGSKIVVVSPKGIEEREDMLARFERRWQHKFVNKIENLQGLLGSPTVWQRLPINIQDASRVFLLADEQAPDPRHADACTIAAVVQLRALLRERGVSRDVPITPEIQDPRTEFLCRVCGISSYVDSSGMPVQVVASVCMAPRLREVMRILVGSDSEVGYCIHTMSDYLPDGMQEPHMINFMEAQEIVSQAGDVLIGWTVDTSDKGKISFDTEIQEKEVMKHGLGGPGQSPTTRRKSTTEFLHDNQAARDLAAQFQTTGESLNISWVTNPDDKLTQRPWSSIHRLCVIGYH